MKYDIGNPGPGTKMWWVICMIFLRKQFSVMLLMTLSFELHAIGFYENVYFYVKIQNVFHIYQDKTK